MQDSFPGNSARARAQAEGPPAEEKPEVKRVVSGDVERRRQGRLGRRFKDTFISGTARGAVEYMFVDVVVPAIQDTLIDAFQGGIERLIKGEGPRGGRRRTLQTTAEYRPQVNYAGMSTNAPPTSTTRTISRQARARMSFDDIVIPSRAEASDVLDRMFDILSRYGVVRVDELYEMTGIASTHTDHKWGWTSLRGSQVRTLRSGGYLLDLPEPEAL
jgi:hypothetical protein